MESAGFESVFGCVFVFRRSMLSAKCSLLIGGAVVGWPTVASRLHASTLVDVDTLCTIILLASACSLVATGSY